MSQIFEFITAFFQSEHLLIFSVSIFLIIELVSRRLRKKLKQTIFSQYDNSTDQKHAEYYLEYYRKSQIIDIVRVLSFMILIGFLIASRTSSGANIFIVATGALIIVFKDFLMSIIAFFAVLPQYQIGNTIGIGTFQGQIIFIRMFSIGLLGKDQDGDSTGKLFVIPSHKFLTEAIIKEDLHSTGIRKEILRIPIKNGELDIPLGQLISDLEVFLTEMLPIMNRRSVGNYQTYIGHRYKIDVDYLEDKCIIISIGLVGKWKDLTKQKQKIIEWMEERRIHGIDKK
ncbi:hypothetical protein KBB25_03375 [Candidatus Gracilibacteria bacterium]|nr:hypothetical protein [Candidatus Gracilibacteria bacterium]